MITLIAVEDADEEADVLRNVGLLRGHFNTPVAPVLNRSGLPTRVAEALRACGVETSIERLTATPSSEELSAGVVPDDFSEWPRAVYASDGVDRGAAQLAAGLCGTTPLPISSLSVEQLRSLPGDNRNVLLLVNPEEARARDILSALEVTAAEKIGVGVVYALDPLEARFVILKSLLVGSLDGRGLYSVLTTSYYVAKPSLDAPRSLGRMDDTEGRGRLFQKDQDVLLLSGHSDPLDASLGGGLI